MPIARRLLARLRERMAAVDAQAGRPLDEITELVAAELVARDLEVEAAAREVRGHEPALRLGARRADHRRVGARGGVAAVHRGQHRGRAGRRSR